MNPTPMYTAKRPCSILSNRMVSLFAIDGFMGMRIPIEAQRAKEASEWSIMYKGTFSEG